LKSLEKFFRLQTSNKGFTALYANFMDPRIGLFKSAIIDEIHKLKNPKSLEQRSVHITNKKYIIDQQERQ
jgi:hypothetical protein